MHHNCPNPGERDRNTDLARLALRVVEDRLCFRDQPNEHTVETTDLLVGYVELALGLQVRIEWRDLTNGELLAVKAWQTYCEELYEAVLPYVLSALRRSTPRSSA